MKFVETSIFTKIVKEILEEEEYRALQLAILYRPEQGRVIKGTGGLRKIRWKTKGSGKRGGIRVIYYLICEDETVFMLYAYKKSDASDLTKEQTKTLKELVEEELK